MKIHHIGYIVKDIEKSMKEFIHLGFEKSGSIIEDENRNIKILFIKNGEYLIELVSPISEKSIVSNLLKKSGSTPYHICYETENITTEISRFESKGFIKLEFSEQVPAMPNSNIAFLYSTNIGLVELVQFNNNI